MQAVYRDHLACAAKTPQVGMVIEPKISVGVGGSSGTTTYDSTGGQPPFNGDASAAAALGSTRALA